MICRWRQLAKWLPWWRWRFVWFITGKKILWRLWLWFRWVYFLLKNSIKGSKSFVFRGTLRRSELQALINCRSLLTVLMAAGGGGWSAIMNQVTLKSLIGNLQTRDLAFSSNVFLYPRVKLPRIFLVSNYEKLSLLDSIFPLSNFCEFPSWRVRSNQWLIPPPPPHFLDEGYRRHAFDEDLSDADD